MNGFLLQPLPFTPIATYGTVQAGTAAYLGNDYAGVTFQIACDNGGSALMYFDLGADTLIDSVLVFGVELFPAAGTLFVDWATAAQGPFTGGFSAGTGAPYAGTTAMRSGKGVSLWLADAPVTARYVALNYTGTGAGQAVRLSRLVVGRRLQPQRNFSFGAGFGVKDLGSLDFGRRGVLQRARGRKLRTTTLTFSSLRRDEAETRLRALLEQVGNTEMIATCTDPAVDPERQNRCGFGPLVGDVGLKWRNAPAWEASINQVSIF